MRQLLWKYFFAYRRQWAIGLICSLGSTAFGLVNPWLLRQAIDTFSLGTSFLGWPLESLALAIIVAATLEAVFRFFSRLIITGASRWVEYDLRNYYFEHLETLEPEFFVRFRTGDLVQRAINDLGLVRQLFGPALYNVTNTVLLFCVALVLMFQLSATLAMWAALVLPATTIVFALSRSRIEERWTRVQEQFSAMSDHAQETFAGQRVVKAYAQEQAEIENFRRISGEYVRRQLRQILLTGLFWPTMSLLLGLLTVFLLYSGGREVVDGRLTIGEFVQFNTYVAMLGWPMMSLGWVATMWQQGSASLVRLHEVLAIKPTIRSPEHREHREHREHAAAWEPHGQVEFRDVSLVVDGRPILSDINLTIPAGATYAIVGSIGSGKTSLVSLIPRLKDVTTGQVLIDGVDVRDLPLSTLRRNIGFVPQETFLFSGSMRENVGFGLTPEETTESKIRSAVRLSQLENDLDQWPAGLDTVVGERGVTLSGGQKQRTAIARAVVREPTIVILDDALSSVDTRTEEAVLDGLHEFMAQRTSIVIAHRLSTTRSADWVVVMNEGRIAEQGTHTELIRDGGLYTRIYRRQLLAQELEEDDVEELAEMNLSPSAEAR